LCRYDGPFQEKRVTKQHYKYIFNCYLAFVGAFLFYVGLDEERRRDGWAMGDWIINYTGGFVRRGLTGELAFHLSQYPPHISVYVWAFLLQLGCYATIFGTAIYLLRGLTWNLWMVALVYSPATLSFTVFNPTFAFRKEILFFALLGIVIVLLSEDVSLIFVSLFVTLTMAALILSHEAMVFYYPYIVGAFLVGTKNVRRAMIASTPVAIAALCAFIAASKHPGTLGQAAAICSSVGGQNITSEPCNGAIIYLTMTIASAHRDVLTAISYWHLKKEMPLLVVMSLGPLVLGVTTLWRSRQQKFALQSLIACSGIAWIATAPLFFFALDWNRWIYIHVFSSLLLMLMIERERQKSAPMPQRSILPVRRFDRIAVIALLALSMCGWQLSFYHHFPLPGERLGLYLSERIKERPVRNSLNRTPLMVVH